MNLPEEQEKKPDEEEKKVAILHQQTTIISPYPPPEILERYAKIDPEFPKIVIKMVKEEQEHRHKTIERGQKFAFVIAIIGIGATIILGIWGNPWVAGAIGFASLASLVGAFLKSVYKGKFNAI